MWILVKLIIHVSMQRSCVSMQVLITLVCIDAWCVCIDTQAVSICHVSMQGSCVSMHRVFCLPCIDAWLVCIDAYWTERFCDLSHAVCIDAEALCIDAYWHKMHFNCYLKGNINVGLYAQLCNNIVGWKT